MKLLVLQSTSLLILVIGALVLTGTSNPATPVQAAQSVVLYGAAADNTGAGNGNSVSSLYRIDPKTGAAKLIGSLGYRGVSAMDFHPDTGKLYAVGRRDVSGPDVAVLMIIDPKTAKVTEVGPINDPDSQERVPDISFRNSDNALFAWDESGDRLATINLKTGQIDTFGVVIDCASHGMAFSPKDDLYLSDCNDFLKLNQTTGAGTLIGVNAPLPPPAGDCEYFGANALDFHPVTGKLYGSLTTECNDQPLRYLAIIDPATAKVSLIGPSIDSLDALAFQVVEEEPDPIIRTNVSGAIQPILTGGALRARQNRQAAAAAAEAPAAATPVVTAAGAAGIRPPSTGDAGLDSFAGSVGVAFGSMGVVFLLTLIGLRRARR